MFDRWKKAHRAVYEVEVKTWRCRRCISGRMMRRHDDTKEPEAEEEITYENVAIPEIHIKRKQRDK